MVSMMIENRITGFMFHPEFEKSYGVDVLKRLKVEFLEKGWVVTETTIEDISEKALERLQEQLMYYVIMNLNITANRIEAEELSKKAKRLGIVNMFKLHVSRENEDGTNDIEIDFIKSGYFAASSQIRNVSESDLKLIEDILSDNTETNLKCTRQCDSVTYLDSLAVIEQKINK